MSHDYAPSKPPTENYGQAWHEADVAKLLELARQHQSLEATAAVLKRTPGAVIAKLETIVGMRQQWDALIDQLHALRKGA